MRVSASFLLMFRDLDIRPKTLGSFAFSACAREQLIRPRIVPDHCVIVVQFPSPTCDCPEIQFVTFISETFCTKDNATIFLLCALLAAGGTIPMVAARLFY